MLQQTRVDTVVPYFLAWMKRFPTAQALADAHEDEVLSAWQGLGYYRRARFIHRAAQEIVSVHGGSLPNTLEGLRSLPGVGSYTAGAIASLAFGIAVPAVDGNALRVLSRIFADDSDISRATTRTRYEEVAASLMSTTRPALFNEAMIELGATICKPTSPACLICPVVEFCEAQRLGIQADLPVKKGRTKVRKETLCAWILRDPTGKVLCAQRPTNALLGGLWEFPLLADPPPVALRASSDTDDVPAEVLHIFSHIRRTIRLFPIDARDIPEPVEATLRDEYADHRWIHLEDKADLAMSTMMRKMLAAYSEWSG